MPSLSTTTKRRLDDLARVFPNAAGLAIGSAEIVVALPPDRDPEPVRVFATFTSDVHALVDWLVASGIDTVAMESTGVFWIPIDEVLEQAGITPIWSMPVMSRPSPDASPIGMMLNGSKSSTPSDCSTTRSDPMPRSAPFAPWPATGPNSLSDVPRISIT